jgi:membrane protease YdiL (CAAX protease family)
LEKQKNVKLAFVFAAISVLATIAVIPYLISIMPAEVIEKQSLPKPVLGTAMALQTGLMVFFLSWAGLVLGNKVGLKAPIFRKWVYREGNAQFSLKWVIYGVVLAISANLLVIIIDRFVFLRYLPELKSEAIQNAWWEGLLAVFYGGLVEEFMARLFVMTVAVWIAMKLFSKGHTIHPSIYWFGIIFAGLVFGALHLPATSMAFGGLTTLLVIRGLLLNLIVAIVFGYLYWKKGLEYAVIAHILSDIILHVL